MRRDSTRTGLRTWHKCLISTSVILLLHTPAAFAAAEPGATEPIFHTRNFNPFTAIFGRPETFSAATLPDGTWTLRLTTNVTSHTEPAEAGFEQLELDGETHHLGFNVDHGLTERWQIGARLPYLNHSGGVMDAIVENWHDVIGASNAQRSVRPRNDLNFIYWRNGEVQFAMDESSHGFGDVQLQTRYRVLGESIGGRKLALHTGIKLPTGNAAALRGSGATDISIGAGYSDPLTLASINTTISAHAGVLFMGTGDVLGALQESSTPFGGAQLSLALGRRFEVLAQIQASGRYYRSDLPTLGDPTVQLSLGANIRFPRSRWNLTLGIVEDAFSDMTPDFALHMELSKTLVR